MKADLFSSATTLFLMVMRSPPFRRAHQKDPYFKRLCASDRKPFWNIFKSISSSAEFRDLFESATRRDPEERLGLNHILDHPWLSSGDKLNYEDLKHEIIKRFEVIEKALSYKQATSSKEMHGMDDESSEAIEMAMKDHEEFEVLRIQATEEIGSYINKKIKLRRELKKMKGGFVV
jgi:serine/threonine protein kinase